MILKIARLCTKLSVSLNLLFPLNGLANEFDELEKKQTKEFVKNPFNNRSAVCTSTTNGVKTSEKWKFIGETSYMVTMSGFSFSGKYSVDGDKLKIEQEYSFIRGKKPSKRSFILKYRLKKNPMKWQYIREVKSGKQLYDCMWTIQ